jgi:glycosyltransferase involved in cell wall biosynthesis
MAHHPRHHYRLAATLREAGFDVVMLAQPDLGDGHADAVPVAYLPVRKGRAGRMLSGPLTMWRAARMRPDAIHVVSLDLLPWAVLLRRLRPRGPAVLYDSNEEYDQDMLTKEWLPAWARPLLHRVVAVLEPWLARRLDAATTAVPATQDKFARARVRSVLVRNFPPAGVVSAVERNGRYTHDVLVGGSLLDDLIPVLADTARELQALGAGDVRWLVAARNYTDRERRLLERALEERGVRDAFDLRYNVPFTEMPALMSCSRIGFVLFKGVAAPQRMFEYMSCGMPFVASDLPWVSTYLAGTGAGDLAEDDPRAYARAIARLLGDAERRRAMSERGPELVRDRFSWEREAQGLVRLYEDVVGAGAPGAPEAPGAWA